jgi:hypothetical protein
MTFQQFSSIVISLDDIGNSVTDDEDDDDDTAPLGDGNNEDDSKAMEIYLQLKGNKKDFTSKELLSWPELKDLLRDKILDKDLLKTLVNEAGIMKEGVVTIDQFKHFYQLIRDTVQAVGGDVLSDCSEQTDENSKEEHSEDENEDEELVDLTDEEFVEITTEIFDELRGKKATVSVKALMEWEDIKEMLADGLITKENIASIVKEAGSSMTGTLNKEQFFQVFADIDELTDVDDSDESDDGVDGEDFDDENFDEIAAEIFDELRGKKTSVSVKKFMEWDDMKDLIAEGLITSKQIASIVKEAGSSMSGELNKEQFVQVFSEIDELTNVEDGDDDAEDLETSHNKVEVT